MNRTIVYIGLLLCFLPLPALGWDWISDSGQAWMKFHPATYLFAIGAMIGLSSSRMRYWSLLLSWTYGPFAIMTLVFIIRAILIARASSDPTGAVGIAITNFLTPILLLVAAAGLTAQDWRRMGGLLRILLIINSIIALVESVLQISFFFPQESRVFRAGGLIGHPLPSALVTSCMIVYLLTANNRRSSLATALPEVVLHAAALFAFGGRTGLVLVPLVVAINALLPAPGIPIVRRIGQRIAITAILASALMATQLQIGPVQAALSRFDSDSGSSDTRYAAIEIAKDLPANDFLLGVTADKRDHLMLKYDTTITIENPWVALILIFGAILVIPMSASLITLLFGQARPLDRSASMMVIYFLIAASGYVSFGSKSLSIVQLLLMISALCQNQATAPAFAAEDEDASPITEPAQKLAIPRAM